ncbi:MAG: hypothetical protein ACRD0J_03445 [Acidimicrobiales bacterium]
MSNSRSHRRQMERGQRVGGRPANQRVDIRELDEAETDQMLLAWSDLASSLIEEPLDDDFGTRADEGIQAIAKRWGGLSLVVGPVLSAIAVAETHGHFPEGAIEDALGSLPNLRGAKQAKMARRLTAGILADAMGFEGAAFEVVEELGEQDFPTLGTVATGVWSILVHHMAEDLEDDEDLEDGDEEDNIRGYASEVLDPKRWALDEARDVVAEVAGMIGLARAGQTGLARSLLDSVMDDGLEDGVAASLALLAGRPLPGWTDDSRDVDDLMDAVVELAGTADDRAVLTERITALIAEAETTR